MLKSQNPYSDNIEDEFTRNFHKFTLYEVFNFNQIMIWYRFLKKINQQHFRPGLYKVLNKATSYIPHSFHKLYLLFFMRRPQLLVLIEAPVGGIVLNMRSKKLISLASQLKAGIFLISSLCGKISLLGIKTFACYHFQFDRTVLYM